MGINADDDEKNEKLAGLDAVEEALKQQVADEALAGAVYRARDAFNEAAYEAFSRGLLIRADLLLVTEAIGQMPVLKAKAYREIEETEE